MQCLLAASSSRLTRLLLLPAPCSLLLGEDAPRPRSRQIGLTAAVVLSSLAVALAFPSAAEKFFAVTGATAVCAVVYVLPIAIHLRLYLRRRGSGSGGQGGSPTAGSKRGSRRHRHSFSFDHRLAARAGGAQEGPDTRWLLAHDHSAEHAAGAAGAAQQAGTSPASRAAAAVLVAATTAAHQQHQEQREAGAVGTAAAAGVAGPAPSAASTAGTAPSAPTSSPPAAIAGTTGEDDEDEFLAVSALLRGHRWTDLSLNRWLKGQSYDSLGSLPQTPGSPLQPGRDSLESPRAGWPAGSGMWEQPSAWWTGEGAQQALSNGQQQPGAAAAAAALQHQQQQQAGHAAVGAGLPSSVAAAPILLPPVPEAPEAAEAAATAALQRGLSARRSGAGGGEGEPAAAAYPCIADVRWGLTALGPLLWHLVLPLLVLLMGVVSSLSVLLLAVAALHRMLKVYL